MLVRYFITIDNWYHPNRARNSLAGCDFEKLTRRRLDLAKATLVPCLRAQTDHSQTLLVRVNPTDPMYEERLALWSSLPHDVEFCTDFEPWLREQDLTMYTHLATARVDDDDGILADHYERTMQHLKRRGSKSYTLCTPLGYVFRHGEFVLAEKKTHGVLTHVSPILSGRFQTQVRQISHTRIGQLGPLVVIRNDPAYIYTKHPWAETSGLNSMRPVKDMPEDIREMFPVDWDRVLELAADEEWKNRD